MTDDEFFQRLRGDARTLRHQPDEATLTRIRARIQSHLASHSEHPQPTVMELLAAWFRPLAATAAAVALAAVIGVTLVNADDISFVDTSVDISVGGDTYRVGD
jgi:negative regulator of sigma E activity